MAFLLTLRLSSENPTAKNSFHVNKEADEHLNMEGKGKTSRAPNFSGQECHFLAELMGERCDKAGNLTRHQVDRSRFSDRITSALKRDMWGDVEAKFNSSCNGTYRKAVDLQKKWENLVAKHRAIYADFIRDQRLTGGGPSNAKYSILTEAVMGVIGKDSVGVCGVGGTELDSTFNQIKKNQEMSSTSGCNESTVSSVRNKEHQTQQHESDGGSRLDGQFQLKRSKCMTCLCDEEWFLLKKKKLRLEIELMEKKLLKDSEQ